MGLRDHHQWLSALVATKTKALISAQNNQKTSPGLIVSHRVVFAVPGNRNRVILVILYVSARGSDHTWERETERRLTERDSPSHLQSATFV